MRTEEGKGKRREKAENKSKQFLTPQRKIKGEKDGDEGEEDEERGTKIKRDKEEDEKEMIKEKK